MIVFIKVIRIGKQTEILKERPKILFKKHPATEGTVLNDCTTVISGGKKAKE